jgi:DNA polymerase elongation subunit (family B)
MSRFYTSVYLDSRRSEFLIRGYNNGEAEQFTVPCEPILYVPSREDTGYKTHKGKSVKKKHFSSIHEARDFINLGKGASGFEVYGFTNYTYPFIHAYYPGEIDYDPKHISVVTIDIEVSSEGGFPNIETADREITAITLRKHDRYVVLGMKDFIPPSENIFYVKCDNEVMLLQKLIKIWNTEEFLPDVLTGWNVEMFDMPYLVNRIKHVLGDGMARKLSPWEKLDQREVEIFGKNHIIHTPVGINVLDYLQLYRKFSFTMQESYRLDHIAMTELGERKLDYSEYESLDEFYRKDFQRYIEYNIRDVDLVYKLEDKLKFIEQVFAIAYDAKVNYIDSFTSVRMWDVIINNYLMDKHIVVPSNLAKGEKDAPIVGGFVKDPQVGGHKWVVSFDLNSLYPHLIMQYNISPETLRSIDDRITIDGILNGQLDEPEIRNELDGKNLTVAASGCFFDKDYKGFLPELMEKMYNDRVVYKQRMIEAKKAYEKNKTYENEKEIARMHNMQLAKKIQLNSCYGALSNIFFRWFDTNLAESITKSGQLSIRWMERKINVYLNKVLKTDNVDYVIACDTDSMYITLDKFIQEVYPGKSAEETVKFIDNVCEKKIEPYIDKCYQELADHVNAYAQKMKMKRECIADKGIWTGKKHYILNVHNQEGVQYAEPKLKIMGIEAVRSSTPSACRANIKKALNLIMNSTEEELVKFIEDFRSEFTRLPFEDIAFPRSVRGLQERDEMDGSGRIIQKGYACSTNIYKLSTPIHVKGALVYNHYLKKNGLENKLPLVQDGEKIKFCYLKEPNPFMCKVVSTPGTMPKQIDMTGYIDYNLQFEKSFLDPLRTILNVIGWKTEKQLTLDSFFV